MTTMTLAPPAAALAVGTAVATWAFRRPPLLGDLVAAVPDRGSPFLESVGRTAVVRFAVAETRLRGLLGAAGSALPAERIGGAAALASAAALLLGVPVRGAGSMAGVVLAFVFLRAPTFVAARVARRRVRAIERDVPLLVDVLALASFAGLAPTAALRRAVSAIDGPLADALGAALADVELGARWRDRLARVAEDVPVPDLRRVIAVLVRTESIGASTTEPLSILADEVRASRRASASERARKAPVQMLFPLVFLVLPAFLLLTVVPVLVATLGSIR